MRPEELAKVGKNINANSGEVTEESIARGVDEEMDQDRKDAVERNKDRKRSAVQQDAQMKAQLKANMVKAVADSAVQVGGAVASSDAVQSKVAAKKAGRLDARADRMVGRGADAAKIEKVRTRSAEAGFRAAQLNPVAYGQETGAYSTPGALYGTKSAKPTVDMGVERAAGAKPTAANFQSQLQKNRSLSTPISSKQQYMKEANRLAQLKKDFGT